MGDKSETVSSGVTIATEDQSINKCSVSVQTKNCDGVKLYNVNNEILDKLYSGILGGMGLEYLTAYSTIFKNLNV